MEGNVAEETDRNVNAGTEKNCSTYNPVEMGDSVIVFEVELRDIKKLEKLSLTGEGHCENGKVPQETREVPPHNRR